MANERPTVLVLPSDALPTLLIPLLEAPRVRQFSDLFALRPWRETEDAIAIVSELVGKRRTLAISDRAWASLLLGLQSRIAAGSFLAASTIMSPLRRRKDHAELAALAAAGEGARRATEAILMGEVALIGRRELDIARDIGELLMAEGHSRVGSPLVASGPNSASPHHSSGARTILPNEPVVFDFGGTWAPSGGFGYSSDTSRTIVTGPPSAEFAHVYSIVQAAQQAALQAAVAGTSCSNVDQAARKVIEDAGFGPAFVHRTGHGIGLETHEEPYIVAGNETLLAEGDAFSVEPGIYLEGQFGVRIEDVVLLTDTGSRVCNMASRDLTVVEA
jgi:D-alanyl-D-alanine dipeptidase